MQKKISTVSRGVILNGQATVAVLDTTALVHVAKMRHALSDHATVLFGKVMTAATFLCSWLKNPAGAISVTVGGTGDYGKILVAGDSALQMRGYVECDPEEEGRLGTGVVSVVRDEGDGLPFVGSAEILSDDIAKIFSDYFAISEQLPTAIALVTKSDERENTLISGGVFLQPLPGAGEETFSLLQQCAEGCSEALSAGDFGGILTSLGATNVETREARFHCHCTRDKAESMVLALGRRDAEKLIEEQTVITVHCDYCNTDYEIDKKRFNELFAGSVR